MDSNSFLTAATADGRALLAAAETKWDRPVPHCPDWDAAGLVRHTGGIYEWMAAIVTTGDPRGHRADRSPQDQADLAGWYLGALDEAVSALGSADPRAATWTFSSTGDRRVGWWCRRLAVEAALHRYDAEHAVSSDGGAPPAALDGEVAAAGVEEFVIEFVAGLLARETVQGLDGTLHLHATDGPLEWWIDLNDPSSARPEHAKADTAIRGTRSDLLLWLTNRAEDSLEVLGSPHIATAWTQLSR